MRFERYAVYWLPGGPLGSAGAAWLGWDARAGRGWGLEAPARYGFHATMRPPFAPPRGAREAEIAEAFEAVAATLRPADLGRLRVDDLGGFLALRPEREEGARAMASALVEGLDALRSPPLPEAVARRRAAGLTPAQDALLERWGYPFVMEEHRLHLTLSGRNPAPGTKAAAEAHFGALLERGWTIRGLSLVGEDGLGRFHLVHDAPCGASAESALVTAS